MTRLLTVAICTLVQNRETHTLDLYMVVTGHSPTKNYKYVMTLVQ